jgi:hypothetical protein
MIDAASGARNHPIAPFMLGVPFSAVITGLFNLSEALPAPLALAAGAGWGIVVGLAATWLETRPLLSACVEDLLTFLGILALAFAACGGVMALLMLRGALDSSSLTGETLEAMFLPMIPYYIAVNAPLELVIMPGLLYLGWRAGKRRIVIVAAVALYFALRVWTYLFYVPTRLGFAETDHTTVPLTAAQRQQAYLDLQIDDPRWILVLVILSILIVAAGFPRLRDIRASGKPNNVNTPTTAA